MLTLINPIQRAEPFDHADRVFEAKFDGFRAAADTVRGQLISRNGNQMKRFEAVLDLLPEGHVFDGELVVLDASGRPLFKELLFGRRRPTYVAFDLLMAEGIDLRPLPLRQRKDRLARVNSDVILRLAEIEGGCSPFANRNAQEGQVRDGRRCAICSTIANAP
jgi:ATP-dependent DNA ligase